MMNHSEPFLFQFDFMFHPNFMMTLSLSLFCSYNVFNVCELAATTYFYIHYGMIRCTKIFILQNKGSNTARLVYCMGHFPSTFTESPDECMVCIHAAHEPSPPPLPVLDGPHWE